MAEPISTGALIGLSAASAAFSGGASLGVSAVKNRRSYKYTKKLLAEQEKYRKLALQDSVDFWKQQNEYDNPLNQTSRLRSAGLSPLSEFGVQGSQGLSSVQGVDASQFQADGARLPSMELAQLAMQNELLGAEVELKKAQAREANSRATGQDNTNSIFDLFKRAQELANDNAELEKRIKAIEEKYAEANAVKDLEIKDSILRETDERISNLMADKLYKEKATEKLKSDMDLIKAQISTESAKQRNLDADTDYKGSLTETENALRDVRKDLTESQRDKIVQDVRNSKALTAKEIEQFAQWLDGNYPTSSIYGILDKVARKVQLWGSRTDESETVRQNLLDYLRGFKD